MSGVLIIGLIVAVWLFVLAPLVLRGYRPIRRTNEAFDETRVVVSGGDSAIAPRKRPRFSAEDVHAARTQTRVFHTSVDVLDESVSAAADEALAAQESAADTNAEAVGVAGVATQHNTDADDTSTEFAVVNIQAQADTSIDGINQENHEDSEAIFVDALDLEEPEPISAAVSEKLDIVLAAAEEKVNSTRDEHPEETKDECGLDNNCAQQGAEAGNAVVDPEPDLSDTPVPYDDAFSSPADFLDPDADYEFPDEVFEEEPQPELGDELVAEDDLTEEDLEFAAKRRGRGGYDPEADAVVAMSRYQRRRRTLGGLFVFMLLSVGAGVTLGGWYWMLAVVALILTAAYLYALRRQVRAENALRAQRIRHMRRARLGVRNAIDEKLGIPERLRRPGAIVLEVDDDSPDFVSLDLARRSFEYEQPETWEDEYVDSRYIDSRRVG